MSQIAINVLPLLLIFFLGVLLKKGRVLTTDNADLLLKLFFYVSLPALILLSIPRLDLSLELICLPIIAICIVLVTSGCAFFMGRRFVLARPTFGVFLIGSAIMNGGFIFPFVFATYGVEGMALAALFDFGNAFIVLSFVYYLACRYGSDSNSSSRLLKKFLCSPPLMSLFVAIFLNLTKWELPGFGVEFLKILGGMTTPLVMLSLGIYFNHRIVRLGPTLSVIAIRNCGGLLLGALFVTLLDIQGLAKIIVLLLSSAPAGINTLTYSSMENLDKEFAASIVSYSTLVGLFLTPLLIFLASRNLISL